MQYFVNFSSDKVIFYHIEEEMAWVGITFELKEKIGYFDANSNYNPHMNTHT